MSLDQRIMSPAEKAKARQEKLDWVQLLAAFLAGALFASGVWDYLT